MPLLSCILIIFHCYVGVWGGNIYPRRWRGNIYPPPYLSMSGQARGKHAPNRRKYHSQKSGNKTRFCRNKSEAEKMLMEGIVSVKKVRPNYFLNRR